MHISNPAVRRARFCARVFAPLAAALILSPPARARLGDDFLDSGAYEREDILREFERLAPPPPKPSAPAAAGGKKRIALVLPISETGAIGIAARALRDGFFAALERDGADVAVDVYDATTAADAVAAVAAAPARGARVIVGPLTRSAAAALARDLPAPEAPVVLLQERPMARARGYYSLSLSAGDEAAHLASTLPDLGYRRALLVIEESGFGARVGERFAQSWLRATDRQAERFVIRRAPDWKRLFERHKIESEEDAEVAIFLAGGGAFVRQARNYIPPRFATFAGSAVYDGAAGPEAFFLENLRFVAQPWIAAPDSPLVARYDNPKTRAGPILQQRFYALGIDAARVAAAVDEWRQNPDGWSLDGVSGRLTLRCEEERCRFDRAGVPVIYRAGRARRLDK